MTLQDESPFRASDDTDRGDVALALKAGNGDRAALEALLRRHQRWVHAIAVRMVLSPAEAADLTQEALLRVVTRIGQFEGQSSFRTWAYRIVMNCFLDAKRGRVEGMVAGFEQYGKDLDEIPLQELGDIPGADGGYWSRKPSWAACSACSSASTASSAWLSCSLIFSSARRRSRRKSSTSRLPHQWPNSS